MGPKREAFFFQRNVFLINKILTLGVNIAATGAVNAGLMHV